MLEEPIEIAIEIEKNVLKLVTPTGSLLAL